MNLLPTKNNKIFLRCKSAYLKKIGVKLNVLRINSKMGPYILEFLLEIKLYLIKKFSVAHGDQIGIFAAPTDHVHDSAIALDFFR